MNVETQYGGFHPQINLNRQRQIAESLPILTSDYTTAKVK